MKKAILVASFFLAACASMMEQKDSSMITKSPNDSRTYKTLVLPNQLEIVLIHDPLVEQSAAAMSVGVGLLNDPMSQQGMAHFLEHLLFMGTEKYPEPSEHSDFISKNGGQSNAYTWLDITNYMFKINSNAYGEALDRFSEFFKSPKLYEKYVDKERNAVNAEWSMRSELDFFSTFRLQRQLMGDHPANRFLIGNLDTLNDKENSNLHAETVKFYNQYYSANIMKLVLLSNKPIAELETLAIKHFTTIKNKKIEKPTVKTELSENMGPKRVKFVGNKDSKSLLLDFTIKANDQDYLAKPNNFVSYLIGSEMPGAPAYLLKQQGLINYMYTTVRDKAFGNYGQFLIQAELTDAGLEQQDYIAAMILQYIDLIKERGIDKKYYTEIHASLSNQFAFLSKRDPFSEVSRLAENLQNYPIEHAINHPYTYEKFEAAPIKRLLNQLTPDNLRVWHINKKQQAKQTIKYYSSKYDISDITANELDDLYSQKIDGLELPAINRFMPESFDIHPQPSQKAPVKITDNNTSEIWFQPSTYFGNEPKGRYIAKLANTHSLSSPKNIVTANIWIAMFRLKMSSLLTEGKVAGITVKFYINNGFHVSIDGMTDKQSEYLSEVLSNLDTSFTQQELENAVTNHVLFFHNKKKDSAYAQTFDALKKLYNKNWQSDDTYKRLAKQVTLDDVNGFINSLKNNTTYRAFAFGNYDQKAIAELTQLIQKKFTPTLDKSAYETKSYWSPTLKSMAILQSDIEVQDTAVLNITMHPEPGVDSQAKAELLGDLMSTEAFKQMRTEEQLAYAVGVYGQRIGQHAGINIYIQSPVKDTKQAQARFDQFYNEYLTILEAVEQSDFETIKQSKLTKLKEQPNNIDEELSPYLNDWSDMNYQYNTLQKRIDATAKVTLNDLVSFYKETVLNKDAARMYIQLRGKKFKDTDFPEYENEIYQDIDQLKNTLRFEK
jgi:protease III